MGEKNERPGLSIYQAISADDPRVKTLFDALPDVQWAHAVRLAAELDEPDPHIKGIALAHIARDCGIAPPKGRIPFQIFDLLRTQSDLLRDSLGISNSHSIHPSPVHGTDTIVRKGLKGQ